MKRISFWMFLAVTALSMLATSTASDQGSNLNISGSVSINGQKVIDETGKWVGDPTDLQGPQGPTGPQGPQGPEGPAGSMACNWSGWQYINGSPVSSCRHGCASTKVFFKMNCSNGKVIEVQNENGCELCNEF